MGTDDLPHRDPDDDGQRLPAGDEPGAATTPYDDGRGTIGLGDRLGGAAPDTNQGKTEPMPPTPGHADPAGTGPHTEPPEVPDLGEMSAGMAGASVASPTVLPPRPVQPAPAAVGSPEAEQGPQGAASARTGVSHRAPGLQGETPAGESVESDTATGAARMQPAGGPDATPPPADQPGDAQGVEVPHDLASPGTSQEQSVVHGVKDPGR